MSKVKRATNEKYNLIFEYLESGELEKILQELTEKQQEENEVEDEINNTQEENELENENEIPQEENTENKKANTILEKYPELNSIEQLKKIIDNKNKIENIHEVMEILDEEAKRIEEEEQRRGLCKEIENDGEKIEEEIAKLYEEKNKLNENDDKKIIDEIDKKIEENNAKLEEKNEELKEKQESVNAKYKEMTTFDLHKRYNEVQNKLSRCNLVFTNLLQGKSWKEVELRQDNFKNRRFTAKDGAEMRNKREAAKEGNKETDKIIKDGKAEQQKKQEEQNQEKSNENGKPQSQAQQSSSSNNIPVYNVIQRVNNEQLAGEQTQNTALIKKDEANEKHFSFGNIVNWFKNTRAAKFVNKIFNKNDKSNEQKEVEFEKYKEQVVEELINSKEAEFKARLKDISNDGIDKMAENRMNANRMTQRTNSRSNNENER